MANSKDEYIIINKLDKYYKYYKGYNTFTTDFSLSTVLTYEESLAACKRLSIPGFRKLKIVDNQKLIRKQKLEKLKKR